MDNKKQEYKEILEGKRCFYCGELFTTEEDKNCIDTVGLDTKERDEKYKHVSCCGKCDNGIEHWLRMYAWDLAHAFNERDDIDRINIQKTIIKKLNREMFADRYSLLLNIMTEDYIIKFMAHEEGINIFEKIREYLKKENKTIWYSDEIYE